MRSNNLLKLARIAALGAALALSSSLASAAATVTLVNLDGPGEGLNDPAPAAPLGGNTGNTLGQQRQIALLHAAGIWAASLNSNVPITIRVAFNALACTATGATLASAGTRFVQRDFPGAPFAGTWYHASLANKLAGADQFAGENQVNAQFNINLGQPTCLAGSPFYYGLDNNEGVGVDLVTTAIHEFGHGLGFSVATTSGTTGLRLDGFPSIWERFMLDGTSGKLWLDMSNAERVASAINFRKLAWTGANTTAGVPLVLDLGTPRLAVSGPNASTATGEYVIAPAAFGPAISAPGVSADIMPVTAQAGDGGGDGCAAFNAANSLAVNGRIAMISRGVCGFIVKVQNAQNAGAVGVIITNNVAGSPITLGGAGPIAIPSLMISLADGNLLRQRLAFRSRTASGVVGNLGVNLGQYAGADTLGRLLLYTPNPFVGGSSVSHWDSVASRNLLMEPSVTPDLVSSVVPPQDLTLPLLRDIGW